MRNLIILFILAFTSPSFSQSTIHYTAGITSYAQPVKGDPEKKKVKKKKPSKARKATVPRKKGHRSCKDIRKRAKRGHSLTH